MWPTGDAVVDDIHPAEAVSPLWLVAGLALLALAVALPLVLRRVRRRAGRAGGGPPRALEALRRWHLGQVDLAIRSWHQRQLSSSDAVRACSGEARTFVGLALDLDVDVMTLEEIEQVAPFEPRLAEIAVLLRASYPLAFAGAPDDPVADLLAGFRAVIQEWR